ncbi:MAG TPA: Crp/Fnr family transcriptional regulator [Sulfuricurvum sp.]|nr:Crp/Fnr family transcriptional regulator [Sulfuricurvum sp.]
MLLEELDFFKGCDPEKMARLSSGAKIKEYNVSDVMVYEEDDMSRVFFLIEGEVKFYKVDRFDAEVFLYTLSGQALLTNIGSLDCDRISCFSNIEFLLPSRVLSCDLVIFKEVVKTDITLLIHLVNLLADQKQLVECTINMGMVFDVTAKVAKMLYSYLDLYNSLKKQEISYRLNIQPATLSRVLAKFMRLGLIVETDHKTVVVQRDELTRYFKEGV